MTKLVDAFITLLFIKVAILIFFGSTFRRQIERSDSGTRQT